MNATVEEAATTIAILVNGAPQATTARTLAQWVERQGLRSQSVATAVNSQFVPRSQRAAQLLQDGDAIVTFQPIEGG